MLFRLLLYLMFEHTIQVVASPSAALSDAELIVACAQNMLVLCRDGLLRGELEACLMFTPPSELLVAQPITSPSQKLLGSYVTQSRALRSQSVPRSKYSQGGGLAAVTEFYGAAGGHASAQEARYLPSSA